MLSARDIGLPLEIATEVQQRLGQKQLRPASVLIALLNREGESRVLLTRRTPDMPQHPGQISFPGGKRHAEDRDACHTALRETEEEVGLSSGDVNVLGYLRDYPTLTGFCITPVVGWVERVPQLRADPREVESLLEIPLAHVLDRKHYQRDWHDRDGLRLPHYWIGWGNTRVWGATAGMLYQLAQQVGHQE